MTSDEAFTKWYCDYAEEACREYGGMSSYPQDNCETGWNAALEWAKSGQEPVLYQGRMQPMCTDRQTWTAWSECTKGTYEDYKRVPENGDWRFESRALYTHPAPAQPAEEAQPLVCERCEELGYDKATYFRLYEQACIELQQIKKQEFVVELEISCTEIEGERIEVLSCDLPAGTHKLYTHPAPAQPVRLSEEEVIQIWRAKEYVSLHIDCDEVTAQINFVDATNAIMDAMLAKGAAQPAVVQQLVEATGNLIRAYVRLLESGKDRIQMLGGDCDPVDVMEANDFYLNQAKAALKAVKGE